ncbi:MULTISPECIES: hypothetical protein [Clostridia]|uniref:hypothetical protein n=1 Tax=Clostridia TaxID=186801 RepID=UPI000EA31A25|nr:MULTISPECIES: hypothetical protein [Clostridia]NBJ70152.1 hypothetical protein [Roseburia sp. 1XD42-34]RKI77109.1 hypothetical protein D7V87_11790 [Clostridium sp. 1xD42-85]
MNKLAKYISNMYYDKKFRGITLESIEQKLNEQMFPDKLIEQLLVEFRFIASESGERVFQKHLVNLHYQVPEPFKKEKKAEQMYEDFSDWIEEEVIKLENETGLPWEEQAEDLTNLNIKARKAQLVLRHRISEVVLELLN